MHRSSVVVCGALALLTPVPSAAVPIFTSDLVSVTEVVAGMSWSFSVGGWDGGGTVTGTFDATDLDLDMQISTFAGEVTGFSASYSGGTIVGPVAFTLADLFGLVYDLDGGPLGDGVLPDVEGIGAAAGAVFFFIGPGPFGVCGIGDPCGTIDGPAATVPEPTTLALTLVGLAGFRRLRSRRRRSVVRLVEQ